ncbi:hypothetical protein RF11_14141 [Thelohanellus kitauei]|uniref:Uncharacterized protein n=1 Tax=Thelohanellus kitauei TaxID=669202 RepID=A0A0C2MCB6_THEKT|nr:hypothetical protein RF11_14141 [Thelohanellus kitauei]
MYEDLKSKHLTIINDDFIKSVFSGLQSYLLNTSKNQEPEVFETNAYNVYKQVMASTLHSFNESNYLEKNTAHTFMGKCNANPSNFTTIDVRHTNSETMHDTNVSSNIPDQTNTGHIIPIDALLKFFTLIYELKFIFGDINSKLDNFNLL